MFYGASVFNQALETWDISQVTNMGYVFASASMFDQPLETWNVNRVTNMFRMFYHAYAFDQPVEAWDVGQVIDMRQLFLSAVTFNQNLEAWDVSAVYTMNSMFYRSLILDKELDGWDVSQVTDMGGMFHGASVFDRAIGSWDVSQVTNMASMFQGASVFNQALEVWDVSQVNSMNGMFYQAYNFDRTLEEWDTRQVADMGAMFASASLFNQAVGSWDVDQVTDMSSMFGSAASFDQALCWNLTGKATRNVFSNSSGSASAAQAKCSCGAGTFYTESTCAPCPAGQYSPRGKSTSCVVCRAGTYASSTGKISCSSCSAGKVSNPGASMCALFFPTMAPVPLPTMLPTTEPTKIPTHAPTKIPTVKPTPESRTNGDTFPVAASSTILLLVGAVVTLVFVVFAHRFGRNGKEADSSRMNGCDEIAADGSTINFLRDANFFANRAASLSLEFSAKGSVTPEDFATMEDAEITETALLSNFGMLPPEIRKFRAAVVRLQLFSSERAPALSLKFSAQGYKTPDDFAAIDNVEMTDTMLRTDFEMMPPEIRKFRAAIARLRFKPDVDDFIGGEDFIGGDIELGTTSFNVKADPVIMESIDKDTVAEDDGGAADCERSPSASSIKATKNFGASASLDEVFTKTTIRGLLENLRLARYADHLEDLGITDIEMLSDHDICDNITLAEKVGMSKVEIRKLRKMIDSAAVKKVLFSDSSIDKSPSSRLGALGVSGDDGTSGGGSSI
jgi:hypothetical protein